MEDQYVTGNFPTTERLVLAGSRKWFRTLLGGSLPGKASAKKTVMAGIRGRKLTDDEVRSWRADVAAKMAALEQRWKRSGHADLNALIGGLTFSQSHLPPWVFSGVLERLRARLQQQPPRDWGRYLLVLEGRQQKNARGRPLSWQKSYEYASKQAVAMGKPFEGGWRAMKDSYQRIARRRKKLGQKN